MCPKVIYFLVLYLHVNIYDYTHYNCMLKELGWLESDFLFITILTIWLEVNIYNIIKIFSFTVYYSNNI